MKFAAMSLLAAFLAAGPALATQTITATFTQPDGGVTTQGFDGTVLVTISGVGQSDGTDFNDAFYDFTQTQPTHAYDYYQLAFGTTALVGGEPAQDAFNFIVGGLPAYQSDHSYTFLLNTGVSTPTDLHFGVSDDVFGDNTGAYTITISEAVPEPATWALMLAGFGGMGAAIRSRRKIATASA